MNYNLHLSRSILNSHINKMFVETFPIMIGLTKSINLLNIPTYAVIRANKNNTLFRICWNI